MPINGSFCFHPVGQGLFYTGLLNGGNKGVFSFVYDCGTLSSRQFLYREIDDFKLLLPYLHRTSRRKLDLLIVSHLHDDHVNGLDYLLNDLDVDTVVIPYTDQATRLLARLESSCDEAFLNLFYLDPVDWLSSRRVRRVMLIGSPKESGLFAAIQFSNNESNALRFDSRCILSVELAQRTSIFYLENDASASIRSFCWQFLFRNIGLSTRKSYVEVVNAYQRETLLSLDVIFRCKSYSRKLARRLREVMPSAKTVNRTSVVVTHEPMIRDGQTTSFWTSRNSFPCDRHRCKFADFDMYVHHCRRTILTGDIELCDNDTKDAEAELWDSDERFAVFQYPHHGARQALSDLWQERAWLTVFSSGIGNRYGHPHPDVLRRYRFPVIVDERNAFDYRIAARTPHCGDFEH